MFKGPTHENRNLTQSFRFGAFARVVRKGNGKRSTCEQVAAGAFQDTAVAYHGSQAERCKPHHERQVLHPAPKPSRTIAGADVQPPR
jgi:hypothetical protein